ncbi:early nodulin-75 [Vigna angularis]|uniref:early nodulin-75 n=1 Tax=Phaseolus angularis TaxID=3914 RepID=UPI0022B4944B|nr:early nodulin-75 [Vigna angularis]
MSPKSMLVLLIAFLLVTSSLAILPPSSPANNDAKPQPHTPKPPYHNKPSPHIENGHPKHHGKPPPHMEDASHKGKPSHIKDTSYDGRLPPDYNAKPPYQGGDPIHSDGKPPHTEPPHHGKPQPMGTTNRAGTDFNSTVQFNSICPPLTTKELPPKEQQGTGNQHPELGHDGHNNKPSHDDDSKPSHHNDKPPHIKYTLFDGRLPPDRSIKPSSGDSTHPDGKPPHKEPRHHAKPPPIGTTKEFPPKEQQGANNPHPPRRPGHGGHNVESTNFRPIDPPGSD